VPFWSVANLPKGRTDASPLGALMYAIGAPNRMAHDLLEISRGMTSIDSILAD
jgi:hypothetical protein